MQSVTDANLIQIVDAALADVAVRSGDFLACRPGCAQCCVGAFTMNALDAERLRKGYDELSLSDPARSMRLRQRVAEYVARTAADYPGNVATGILDESEAGQAGFEEFANDELCPVLDPENRTCDLYRHRPMTCRVFGPPVRVQDEAAGSGLGVCELCFVNATQEEIAACEMVPDPENLENALLIELEKGKNSTQTTVGYALSTHFAGLPAGVRAAHKAEN